MEVDALSKKHNMYLKVLYSRKKSKDRNSTITLSIF
jgi:hypothetical protein